MFSFPPTGGNFFPGTEADIANNPLFDGISTMALSLLDSAP